MSASPGLQAFAHRAFGLARRHLWVLGALGCLWLMLRSLEFSPPEKVRISDANRGAVVGEAQAQDFSAELQNPQAVQVRASLRQFQGADQGPLTLDADESGDSRLLSQPVVTTILGMSANIDQTIRLQGGDLVVSLHVSATPRILVPARKGKSPRAAMLSLEHEIEVRSVQRQSWGRDDVHMIHLQSRGSAVGLERSPQRTVFEVDGELFALDLELNAQR